MKWIASAAFGMEGMTGRDLKHLGMQNVRVMDVGGAMFEGDFADAFRANVLSRGSSEDEAVLYRRFRGHEPDPDALLKKLEII